MSPTLQFIIFITPVIFFWISVIISKKEKSLHHYDILTKLFFISACIAWLEVIALNVRDSRYLTFYFLEFKRDWEFFSGFIPFWGCISVVICCVRYIYLSKIHKIIADSICDAIPNLCSKNTFHIQHNALVDVASKKLNTKFILDILGDNVSYWHGECEPHDYTTIYNLLHDKKQTVYMVCIDYLLSGSEYHNNFCFEPFIFCLRHLLGNCSLCRTLEKAHKIAQARRCTVRKVTEKAPLFDYQSEYEALSHIFIEYGKLPDLDTSSAMVSLYQLMQNMVKDKETYQAKTDLYISTYALNYIEYLVKHLSKEFDLVDNSSTPS